MCSCQRTNLGDPHAVLRRIGFPGKFAWVEPIGFDLAGQVVGVTGVEPVTLRLSSACSNQLSYTPRALAREFQISNLKFEIRDWWS